jgi:hypothetical protein
MLVDELLPTYDVSDSVAVVVDADVSTTWSALMQVDLIELGRTRPLLGLLGGVRLLPEIAAHLLHGEAPPNAPGRLVLRGTASAVGGDWVLLGERPDDEIALGLVGKFWRPVIEYSRVGTADFRDWAEPGYAKTVYSLAIRPLASDCQTLLTAVMRTATTDEHARRWFRRYWTFGVGTGAHVLATGLVEAARDAAEAASIRQPQGGTHA